MRDGKFRAKALNQYDTDIDGVSEGDWVEGYYYFSSESERGVIVANLMKECGGVGSGLVQAHIDVDPKTVGESTGLHDSKGKEIYEGDIVRFYKGDRSMVAIALDTLWEVVWMDYQWFYLCQDSIPSGRCEEFPGFSQAEIIGNVHENPELLGEST